MRAISVFSLEAGTSSFWWRARIALRMRARKSATGSVRLIPSPSFPVRPARGRKPAEMVKQFLPARLHYAGDFALQRQSTEAQTADAELTQKTARTSAKLAPIVLAGAELRLPRVLYSFCSGCHKLKNSSSRPRR